MSKPRAVGYTDGSISREELRELRQLVYRFAQVDDRAALLLDQWNRVCQSVPEGTERLRLRMEIVP